LLAKRAGDGNDDAFQVYMARSANPPYQSMADVLGAPEYATLIRGRRANGANGAIREGGTAAHYEYLQAREELMAQLLKVMADHQLDAIVHKTVEHQPTLIKDGVNPPYLSSKGATHLNTYLIYVPSLSVPAGFTTDSLPVGITFLGRPYSDASMVKYAYAYEQATHHRRPPETTPPVAGEP
jgi:Asp-tRNA(Asn)/Glu-tRNA(Gln) amidotransferase A subunit family amidase